MPIFEKRPKVLGQHTSVPSGMQPVFSGLWASVLLNLLYPVGTEWLSVSCSTHYAYAVTSLELHGNCTCLAESRLTV